MNERVKFIAAYLADERSFSEICEIFGVSRKTGYKWVERYENGGVGNLLDRPRVPNEHPHATRREIVDRIIALRKKHPRWGPRKLLVVLRRQQPELELPVASTAGEILKRHGLVKKRRRKIRSAPFQFPLEKYTRPNAIWCADFKGWFYVGKERCCPLTISDGFSRFILRCEALRHQTAPPTREIFESAFREFGLPDVIRTDNGTPFSTLSPGGLSALAVWWIRLGIRPERIRPGRPQENGRHERMHRTLKAETARPPATSFAKQQRSFDDFRRQFNEERPHEALSQQVPAALYTSSPRPFPRKLPEVDYPNHFLVARVHHHGVIAFHAIQVYVSICLAGEFVGLERIDEDRWQLYFSTIPLGIIDFRLAKVGKTLRKFVPLIRTDGRYSEVYRTRKV